MHSLDKFWRENMSNIPVYDCLGFPSLSEIKIPNIFYNANMKTEEANTGKSKKLI